MPTENDIVRGSSRFSFKRIAAYGVALALCALAAFLVGGAMIAIDRMQRIAADSVAASKPQIESRVGETFKLLSTLADQPALIDPATPVMDKVRLLDQVNEHYGYFLICYIDADMNVWDETGPASLASRDYLQKLFATGETVITDSFPAGADGATLNYTVAEPLMDEGGAITGALFASLYFSDIVDILARSVFDSQVESAIIGSTGQIMSATPGYAYGDQFLEPLRPHIVFGMSADKVESELRALNPVSFWTVDGLNVRYYVASPLEGTSWDVICTSSFWNTYAQVMTSIAPVMIVVVALIGLGLLLIRHHFSRQMEKARLLEKSVIELERKVYSDERPDDVDMAEILELTSSGLTDGLTGVVTRSVFTSKLDGALRHADGKDGSLYALCFIDLDDFKLINDAYGHAAGDVALKSVGYLLREYERRYEGLVGRYGGDEFVLLMTDLDDEAELVAVLDEMVEALHVDVKNADCSFMVHGSMGVAIWDRISGSDALIDQADKALYLVKQQGKQSYCLYRDEDQA
ncbi:MAG: sensor domain-containing diguanylate cyclase [Gordonibacter sp.]